MTGQQTWWRWAGTGLLRASRLGPRLQQSSGRRELPSGQTVLPALLPAAAPGAAPAAPGAALAAAGPPSEHGQISAAVGQHTASVQEGLVLVTPKAGSVTVVGSVVVGFEQWGTAEPEVVAGDAVDDAAVTAAGVGPEKGEAVAAALMAAALVAGPAKPAAVAAVAVAAAATVPSSAVAAVVSKDKIITVTISTPGC